jgi:hypothetical protein
MVERNFDRMSACCRHIALNFEGAGATPVVDIAFVFLFAKLVIIATPINRYALR